MDGRSPTQDAALAVLMVLADAVRRSWEMEFNDGAALRPDLLDRLLGAGLPERISLKRPEGYAFYALYPESYLQAASAFDRGGAVRVIGIRSIGSGLAALVASALGVHDPMTVRPIGDPFRRHIKVSDELAAELLEDAGARFAIVDEGPGLSGSSFGAVADWLEARGVAPANMDFFPSHPNDLGPMASAPHRQRWRSARRHVVDFDELVLGAPCHMHRLEGWVADLTGPPEGPLENISGGAWRPHRFSVEDKWPPCHVQQERRKFLLRAGGVTWLLKFVGLGREGAEKLAGARSLHAAGFAPEPAGYRYGFLVERWRGDAQPVTSTGVDRATLVERLGSYIGFRARSFPAEPQQGASLTELFHMARHNTARGLDEDIAKTIEPWGGRVADLQGNVRRVRTDNRLHPWEWLRTADGRLLKTDALDHHAAHDLVGCQDATWDIAGAKVEFDLADDEVGALCEAFQRTTDRTVSRGLLQFYEICYAAFQLGHWSLATESLVGFPDEAKRTSQAAERCRGKLRRILQRA